MKRTSPQPNNIPPSLHLVRAIIGCKELWELEYHVCPCHMHAYEPLHPSQWVAVERQQQQQQQQQEPELFCPRCGHARFKTVVLQSGVQSTQPFL
eukprot:scaffold231014_cov17-Tisochrysis_lutea.AAC.1